MAGSEKLDLILEKVTDLEHGLKDLKWQQMKDIAELKAMDSVILDEVKRVQELLIKRRYLRKENNISKRVLSMT